MYNCTSQRKQNSCSFKYMRLKLNKFNPAVGGKKPATFDTKDSGKQTDVRYLISVSLKGTVPRISRLTQGPLMSLCKHFMTFPTVSRRCHNSKADCDIIPWLGKWSLCTTKSHRYTKQSQLWAVIALSVFVSHPNKWYHCCLLRKLNI